MMATKNILIKRQKGFTLMGWVLVLAIFGFFAYLAMIMTPVLISNHSLTGILESLKEEPGITQKSKREVKKLIYNRLIINGVKDVKTSDFEIVKEGANHMIIYLDFENRIKFANNIFILLINKKEVELLRN